MDRVLEEWSNLHKFHLYSGAYRTQELADFLKVSPRTIQRWMKEESKPTKKQLLRIKSFLEKDSKKFQEQFMS